MQVASADEMIVLKFPNDESRCTSRSAESGRADESRREEVAFCSWCGCNGKMGWSKTDAAKPDSHDR